MIPAHPSRPACRFPSPARTLSTLRLLALCALLALLAACARPAEQAWANHEVTGHLPDLEFRLTGGDGRPLQGRDLRGKVVLMYFGYTHCPDVCPLSMSHLHQLMQRLGPAANGARILFVSVDPARDTPDLLGRYAAAFDPRAIGATGTPAALRALAKRYRVAFSLDPPDSHGDYEVSHSSAVFVFDRDGRARVLATSADDVAALAQDVSRLLEEPR